MAYNHGREDRKWRIWKEAEEKLLRECGVDEATIEQIRMADRADFNSKCATASLCILVLISVCIVNYLSLCNGKMNKRRISFYNKGILLPKLFYR